MWGYDVHHWEYDPSSRYQAEHAGNMWGVWSFCFMFRSRIELGASKWAKNLTAESNPLIFSTVGNCWKSNCGTYMFGYLLTAFEKTGVALVDCRPVVEPVHIGLIYVYVLHMPQYVGVANVGLSVGLAFGCPQWIKPNAGRYGAHRGAQLDLGNCLRPYNHIYSMYKAKI